MYYTGFADEAADSIEKQIEVTKKLGWEYIESRSIEGTNLTDISDEKFEEVAEKLKAAGVKVNCFGSAVANWGKDPREEDSFKNSMEELKRAIPRMQKLGTKMIRGMSYGIPKELSPENSEIEAKIIDHLKKMVKMCEEAGITYVHENCMNYFSQSYQHMDKLLAAIDSPNFKIVYDTGNPLMADNRMGEAPYEKQTSWGAYQHLKDKIAYVHIKDGTFVKETNGIFPEMDYCYPGEGNGEVKRIIKDLLAGGYDGGFSIEPHMGAVYHEDRDDSQADAKYNTYLEYGKRFKGLMEEIRSELEED
ncbi:sugar phosphate isomerase/epimerase [Halanaerobium saccharolyticum]|uniref:Sugar phosphate isomerase/epimerase n=1 Tax=Halanaerobium saccharolyticum TaxID=43595 RepID=A0A4R7Z978_9FIRM|nr:sugar phosphate isomerase/epimerase family protein [Halanaerobium saccharolyticum]RAK12443.1 sugar phosphate isomerase/epimerase [Halanaerobium saccharolyticum]TDW06369.1 sugar phosphate isomerase/epimerase [Halanaerobium saccharolyticum]TDX61617.1 sugar phosphate isomerase/epimerase [Halanaerobium saccharolyticum]